MITEYKSEYNDCSKTAFIGEYVQNLKTKKVGISNLFYL